MTLTDSRLLVNFTGTGAACMTWLDAISSGGAQMQFDDVTYQDGVGNVDVTVTLTP